MSFKKIIAIVVVFLNFALFFYLGKIALKNFFYHQKYELDFRESNFLKNKNFYIDENYKSLKFASFGKIKNNYYAQIAYTPLFFVFKSKNYLINKKPEISIYVKGDKNWQISLYCDECPKEQQFNWQNFGSETINEKYSLIAKFKNTYIYSKINKNWLKEKDIDFWIIKNINPQSKVLILNNSYDKNKLLNPDYPKDKNKYMYILNSDNPDFIISDFYQNRDGVWTKISKELNLSKKTNTFKFAIRNKKLLISKTEKNLLSQNFQIINQINNYKIYSKTKTPLKIKQIDDLGKIIDKNDKIFLDSQSQKLKNIFKKSQISQNPKDCKFAIVQNQNKQNTFIKKITIEIK